MVHQGPPVHGILQARILELVAIPFSRGSSQPRNHAQFFCIAGRFFTVWAIGKTIYIYISGSMVFHMNYYVMLPFHILFSNNTCLWVWITGEFASTISVSSYFVSMQRPQKSNGLNVNVTFLCIHTERNLTHSVWVVTPQTKVSSCFRELT